jgi:hypothetical protein
MVVFLKNGRVLRDARVASRERQAAGFDAEWTLRIAAGDTAVGQVAALHTPRGAAVALLDCLSPPATMHVLLLP